MRNPFPSHFSLRPSPRLAARCTYQPHGYCPSSPPVHSTQRKSVTMALPLLRWFGSNSPSNTTHVADLSSPLIPGLSAPIPINETDVSALIQTLSDASNRAYSGCRHAEHPDAVQIALSYQHDMASDTHRFPIPHLLQPLLGALETPHFSNASHVQLWIDGLMPYQDLSGQQWFEVGMNPYADYYVLSVLDDGIELSNRLWIRLERTLGRLQTQAVTLQSQHMLYVRTHRSNRQQRLRNAAVEILTRLHDQGETYWIDDKDRLYEWALSVLHLNSDTCNIADIVRMAAEPGTTYHVSVPGLFQDPNDVLRAAFNLEGRFLEIGPDVTVVARDNREVNKVDVHLFLDQHHLVLHAKHLGRRYGTDFADCTIMDTLATTVPRSRFIGEVEEAVIKQLNSYLQSGTVTIQDIVDQDRSLRLLHNMRPIGQIFTSDERGRLLWKYTDTIFVSYSSRRHTSSSFGTLNMIKGSSIKMLPQSDCGKELLKLANDLSVPAEIRAMAVHDYGLYDGHAVIELAPEWSGGRKKGTQIRTVIGTDQNHPGRISQVDRKTYLRALFLGVMERKGLSFKQFLQRRVSRLADKQFYGKMASGRDTFLSTQSLSRNVGAFMGDKATRWQTIAAITDRKYHPNNFLFSTATTYRTRIRGLDIHAYDQNSRMLWEAFVPRGFAVIVQVIILLLDLFLPNGVAHGIAICVGLFTLKREFATPGRNGATVSLEILVACATRLFGRYIPLITSAALDYYFYSGRHYNMFHAKISFRRTHLLHAINNFMKNCLSYRWRLLSLEIALQRTLKRRAKLRENVVALLKDRDTNDKYWVHVLGTAVEGQDGVINATADELAAAGVFLTETTTGDIVLVSEGRGIAIFAFRNRAGVLFFKPYVRESVSQSLTGRVIVGDVVIRSVEEIVESHADDERESEESDEESNGGTISMTIRPGDPGAEALGRMIGSAAMSAVNDRLNSDCRVQ